MNSRRMHRVLVSAALAGGTLLASLGGLLPMAGALAVLPGCGADCKPQNCSEFGAADKKFLSCAACVGESGCDITLEDPSGKEFYHCSDSDGKKCSTDSAFVAAEESYCGL